MKKNEVDLLVQAESNNDVIDIINIIFHIAEVRKYHPESIVDLVRVDSPIETVFYIEKEREGWFTLFTENIDAPYSACDLAKSISGDTNREVIVVLEDGSEILYRNGLLYGDVSDEV